MLKMKIKRKLKKQGATIENRFTHKLRNCLAFASVYKQENAICESKILFKAFLNKMSIIHAFNEGIKDTFSKIILI
jgi:hypothetical protein